MSLCTSTSSFTEGATVAFVLFCGAYSETMLIASPTSRSIPSIGTLEGSGNVRDRFTIAAIRPTNSRGSKYRVPKASDVSFWGHTNLPPQRSRQRRPPAATMSGDSGRSASVSTGALSSICTLRRISNLAPRSSVRAASATHITNKFWPRVSLSLRKSLRLTAAASGAPLGNAMHSSPATAHDRSKRLSPSDSRLDGAARG
mmetsp:Transcript_25254/g.65975  ORF Transcript_25254/g.65975 Transcript_25254/m.65975 type:complete len:201 (+) Transcript_25254:1933-2535(+)